MTDLLVTQSVFEILLDGDDDPKDVIVVTHTCPPEEVIPRLGQGLAQALRTLDTDDEYDEDQVFTWQDFRWEHTVLLSDDRPVVAIEGIVAVRFGLDNYLGEVDCYAPLVPRED